MEKHRKLINRLLESTRDGLSAWEETGQAMTYQLSFANSSVRIREAFNREQMGNDYFLDLMNGFGQVVETVSDVELDRDGPSDPSFFRKMQDLFELAKRRALGADEVIDDILDELEKQIPF